MYACVFAQDIAASCTIGAPFTNAKPSCCCCNLPREYLSYPGVISTPLILHFKSTSGPLVVSGTDSEKMSVCLSHQGHSMVTYGQLSFKTAHAARIRSKPSRKRSLSSKPHLFACPVCGVIKVDFQHPERGDVSSPKASGFFFC